MEMPELNNNLDYNRFTSYVHKRTLQHIGIINGNDSKIDPQLFKLNKYATLDVYTETVINLLIQQDIFIVDSTKANFKLLKSAFDLELILNIEKEQDCIDILGTENNVIRFWKEINTWECSELLFLHLKELHLPYVISEKLLEIFDELLDDFSAAQIYNLSYSAIESTLYQLRKGQLLEDKSLHFIQEIIQTKASRALTQGYNIHNYSRPVRCPQSELSKYYFEKVLGIGDNGFNCIPNIDIIKLPCSLC